MSPSAVSALSLLLLAAVAHAAQFQVTVGGGGSLRFDPETVNATQGDTVLFTIQGTHTATQSTFDQPCVTTSGGFDSGFVGSAEYTVQSTDPVWFYCKTTGHCQAGMVFAINPGSQFSAFQSAATGNAAATSSSASGTTSASASASASSSAYREAAGVGVASLYIATALASLLVLGGVQVL